MSRFPDHQIRSLTPEERSRDIPCDSRNCDQKATYWTQYVRFYTYDLAYIDKFYCPKHTEKFTKKQAKRERDRASQVEELKVAHRN